MNKLVNYLIVGGILAILYAFVGHGYVKFYFGGKAEFLDLASSINEFCNTRQFCPATPAGWPTPGGKTAGLGNGNLYYYPVSREGAEENATNGIFHEFRLVYGFFAPGHWFEAGGGVGRKLTSGWRYRDTPP